LDCVHEDPAQGLEKRALPLDQTLHVAVDVANALAKAHRQWR
jgi:hypothetical protein